MASIGFKKAEIECNDVPCCIRMPTVERRENSGVKKKKCYSLGVGWGGGV